MHKDGGKYFLLDESKVNEINALLLKYQKCSDLLDSRKCIYRECGCDGCEFLMTDNEDDAAWALTESFRDCMSLGILRDGKTMNEIEIEDVPHEVCDEIYAKWSRLLDVGWTPSAWTGCSLCAWMANELGVSRMRDVDCELCPIYEDEWCRSLSEDSKIHMDYADCMQGSSGDGWRGRVEKFLMFIKPYCSKDEDSDIRGDILEYIMANGGMYDMVGVSMRFSSLPAETIYSIIDSLVEEGMVEKGFDDSNIYALRVTEDGENA